MSSKLGTDFSTIIQAFFTRYLVDQRALSPRTVAAYRDCFMLFISYAEQALNKSSTDLNINDLTPELIIGFLDDLEKRRGNSVRTRNARLAAIRSFLKFAAHCDVVHLHETVKALSVPMKRFEKPIMTFLSREHMLAVLAIPGNTWIDMRDRLLLQLLYNTGARISEMIAVKVEDAILDKGACLHLLGKGRKHRSVPLWPETVKLIRQWIILNKPINEKSPLLPTRRGEYMTRANAALRIARAVKLASTTYPELTEKQISPHTIRHTTAMRLLQSGVDIIVIALWLGHESPSTTHMYIEADLRMKEQALARVQSPDVKSNRYQPPDPLRAFLQAL